LTKIPFSDKMLFNITKCVDEIKVYPSCLQRVGAWCKPIHKVKSVSFLSRVIEGSCCVGDHGRPVIMAKGLSES